MSAWSAVETHEQSRVWLVPNLLCAFSQSADLEGSQHFGGICFLRFASVNPACHTPSNIYLISYM